jgi:hypothetical protein
METASAISIGALSIQAIFVDQMSYSREYLFFPAVCQKSPALGWK